MDEFDPVAFSYLEYLEILTINESAVDLDDHRWIVFLGPVQQVLDGKITSVEFLDKTVESDLQ